MTHVTQYPHRCGQLCDKKRLTVKYIIIGAVAGGATTAARLRRLDEQAEIVIFEKGQHISYANCGLPYYIGDVIKDRSKLFVQTASAFATRFNIDVRANTEVTAISTAEQTVTATDLKTGEQYTERYDKLVLSPGAKPIRPSLPGIGSEGIFTVRNVADTDYIKEYLSRSNARTAVIIGAGFIGLEMAENFHALGLDVSVVEMGPQILAPLDLPIAAMAQKHLREQGINLFLDTVVTGFLKHDAGLTVLLKNGGTLDADVVILSMGVRPDTALAERAGLQLGPAKGIQVNKYLQTSDENVYAVGDAIEFANPISGQSMITNLAGPANKQGRICANNVALGNKHVYKGSINTAILKLFDVTVGVAGMAAKELQKAGIKHVVSTIHGNSNAGYYPGARLMTIQIAFSPVTGRLFSAQVIGNTGVDKRLDLLAAIIKNNGSIYDLTEIEHGYAPPFSSAKDPVNMAGFVAENILVGKLNVIQCMDLPPDHAEHTLIDVRTETEHMQGTIAGAINIPLDQIRNRIQEIPADKPVFVFCQQGMRGYLAQRILVQNGFTRVTNVSGGYLLCKTCFDEMAEIERPVCLN